jgi:O-antigen/teichoic acid export membrane protein
MQNHRLLKHGHKIISSPFLRNVFTLITGTAFAQFIPIALSPVLTRVYSPEDFGVLAIYMSATMVLSTASTARYEQAVVLPDDDNDSLSIVLLCVGIALLFSLSLWLILFICSDQIEEWVKIDHLNLYLKLLPFSVLLLATYQSLYYWFNREKLYKAITFNKVALAISMVTAQLALCKVSKIGLVVGYVFGQMIALGWASVQLYLALRSNTATIDISRLRVISQAKRYIKFPKFLLFGHVMNSLSGNMPIILLSGLYGASFSGYYSLPFRVLTLPMSLIGSSIGDVFRQVASKQYSSEGQCLELFLKTFKSLFLIGFLPFTTLFIASPSLFPFFFGPGWVKAGKYAYLLTPMLFFQFITTPLCSMFIIAEKQELDLIWQIFRMILSVGSIYCGYIIYSSDEASILLFSAGLSILYLAGGLMSYSFSNSENKTSQN